MQADLKVIIFIHRIAQYMYLSPCVSKNKFVFRLVGAFLAIFSIPLGCVLLRPRVTFFKRLPTSCFIMDLANFFMGYTCLAIFCGMQNIPRRNWRAKVSSRIVLIERMLTNMKFSFKKNKQIVLKYWILHGVYILIHSLQLYDWSSRYDFDIISSYLEFRIVNYWAGFSTLMIFEWLNFIRRRYEHLDQYVKTVVSQKVLLLPVVVKELRLIGEVYKNLTELTVELNALFSFHLFFVISVSMVLTLHGLSFSLVLLYTLVSSIAALIFVVVFFVSL
ncbi:hypothetical protein HUJ05_003014 [Dendroctonus ponderosae]|nr:hypothetical protein HUJ05_003014 [Dendroctonus ponderosae]